MTCRLGESPPGKEESLMIRSKFRSTHFDMPCGLGYSPHDKEERHNKRTAGLNIRMLRVTSSLYVCWLLWLWRLWCNEENKNVVLGPLALNMTDPTDRPHIDSKTRSLLDIKQYFRGEEAATISSTNAITAVTQITADSAKLKRLEDLASRWSSDGGYISVAIYEPDEVAEKDTSKTLQLYFEKNSLIFKRTIVQLVTDKRPKGKDDNVRSPHEYPINVMRNIAIDSAPTDHIMYVDVDFMPSVRAHSHLVKQVSLMDDSTKTALILPSFEQELATDDEGKSLSTESAEFLIPGCKSDLLRLVTSVGSNNTIIPFHMEKFAPGHMPTEFHRWFKASEPYMVEYANWFEPYFVIKKKNIPPFWEYFRGRFYNKWTWVGELSLAGYSFYVDPSCFLIHINHKYFKDKRTKSHEKEMIKEFDEWFSPYLRETYGTILPKVRVTKSTQLAQRKSYEKFIKDFQSDMLGHEEK